MKRNRFNSELAQFSRYVIDTAIKFEQREALFIRRIRLLVDGERFRLVVNKQRNKWADDQKSAVEEERSKKRFEEWILNHFASFWIRYRICKFYFELDIRNGGVIMKAYDWGIMHVPNHPVFKTTIASFGRNGTAEDKSGFLYDDPDYWSDGDLDAPGFKPLSILIRQSEPLLNEEPSREIYEPPEEEQ